MVESTKATLICGFLFLLAVGGILATETVHAAAPPLALDGVGVTTSNWPLFHGVKSQLLNTTKGNDVIVLIVESGPVSAIIDSSGLIFSQRLSYQPSFEGILEFYARATSPLISDNITVVCQCMPGAGMQVLAIHGANTRAIFDPNPSIPAMVTCTGSWRSLGPSCGDCTADFTQGTCSATIQTSTFDFVIATTTIGDAGACGPSYQNSNPPPGFTTITSPSFRSSTFSSIFEVDYTITTTPKTTVTFNCKGTDVIAIVVDAIAFNGAFGTA